jgi:hypothetical protein
VGRTQQQQQQALLHATPPTMVIFWSIKSGFDYVNYALGNADNFRGTGVWSGIRLEREKPDDVDGTTTDATTRNSPNAKKQSSTSSSKNEKELTKTPFGSSKK